MLESVYLRTGIFQAGEAESLKIRFPDSPYTFNPMPEAVELRCMCQNLHASKQDPLAVYSIIILIGRSLTGNSRDNGLWIERHHHAEVVHHQAGAVLSVAVIRQKEARVFL